MCFVLVGSKESDNPDQQARVSCSPGEMLLISELPVYIKQGFIAAKCTFKSVAKHYQTHEAADGRSHVGSYHLKTTLLHHLEKTPPSQINSPYQFMIDVLHDLHMYLKNGTLPHYFLSKCNLLATVGHDERQIALQTIQKIFSDPVVVLQCPSEPNKIYGDDIWPDDLVVTFRRVFTDPSCERTREDLSQLLSRLDEYRLGRYAYFCRELKALDEEDEDADSWESWMPELTRLVDMLQKIKHVWIFIYLLIVHGLFFIWGWNKKFVVTTCRIVFLCFIW